MLGYFAIYGGRFSRQIQDGARATAPRRRWWQMLLPHEIAALNAR